MSDVVSEVSAVPSGAEVFVESDVHETVMEYDPTGRMPILVILVWISAMLGLGAYLVAFYFPDLALWGTP